MVTLSIPERRLRSRGNLWLAGAGVVLVLGTLPRLLVGGAGERSAAWLAVVLEACVCGAAWLLGSPRAAFVGAVASAALLELAAVGPRGGPPYDDRQALYRTDQTITLQASGNGAWLPVWVEPHFAGQQPGFRLSVNGTPVVCPWQRGVQHFALPVSAAGQVRLSLTGAPARDGDYLVVYSSAQQPSIPLQSDSQGLTTCPSGAG